MEIREKVVIKENVVVVLRKELYILMYNIAKRHRDLAEALDGKDEEREIEESMISILFSYTCLEAYINAVGRDRLGAEWQGFKKSSTEAKWKGVSNRIAEKKYGKKHSVFSDRKEPLKSFKDLEQIRNEMVVHWKAKGGAIVANKYRSGGTAINTFNCDKAKWACKTVSVMVHKLNRVINDPYWFPYKRGTT
jgi:hypothetical protein